MEQKDSMNSQPEKYMTDGILSPAQHKQNQEEVNNTQEDQWLTQIKKNFNGQSII